MKSLELINHNLDICKKGDTDFGFIYKREMEQIKQDLEVFETILDNCENKFLDVLHECLIRGTPIHPEDIQRLSGYINKILTIKKQWLEENENDRR